MEFKLIPAEDTKHKWVGVFTSKEGKETKIPFGARGYEDLTMHKNKLRRTYYIARHRSKENWNSPLSAGALSRWILWETPDLNVNVKQFKEKFNLK